MKVTDHDPDNRLCQYIIFLENPVNVHFVAPPCTCEPEETTGQYELVGMTINEGD